MHRQKHTHTGEREKKQKEWREKRMSDLVELKRNTDTVCDDGKARWRAQSSIKGGEEKNTSRVDVCESIWISSIGTRESEEDARPSLNKARPVFDEQEKM